MAESLLTEARNILNSIETAITDTLYGIEVDETDTARAALIDTIKEKISADDELPDEVVNAFAETVADKITDSVEDSTTLNFISVFKSLVSSIVDAFSSLRPQTVTVDGVTYSLSYNPIKTGKISLTLNKLGTISSTVTWTDADGVYHDADISWKDFTKSTLKSYFNTLKDLAEDFANSTLRTLQNIADAVQLASTIRALYTSGSSAEEIIKEVFGDDAVKSTIKSELENYIIENLPDGAKKVLALSQYSALNVRYNQLSTAVDKGKSVEKKAQAFIKTANKIETALELEQSELIADADDGTEFNFSDKTVIVSDDFDGDFAIDDYQYATNRVNASLRAEAIEITGSKKADTILGGAGDDWIEGGKGKDFLIGHYGDDTLIGGAGNDTLWGNDGRDVFVYDGAGNDLVLDYTEGDDIVRLVDVTITSGSTKGDDVILKVGSKKLTLKDAVDAEVVVEDGDGNRTTYINGEAVESGELEIDPNPVEPTTDVYWFDGENITSELDQIVADGWSDDQLIAFDDPIVDEKIIGGRTSTIADSSSKLRPSRIPA